MPDAIEVGTQLGEYCQESRLGGGGFADTYLAPAFRCLQRVVERQVSA